MNGIEVIGASLQRMFEQNFNTERSQWKRSFIFWYSIFHYALVFKDKVFPTAIEVFLYAVKFKKICLLYAGSLSVISQVLFLIALS